MGDPDPGLLESLRAAGTVDSNGAFTIDPARARQALGHARLAHPEDWVAEVVATAVASGASTLAFDGECGAWEVEYDAAAPPYDEFETAWQRGTSLLAAIASLVGEGRTVTVAVTTAGWRRVVRFTEGAAEELPPCAADGRSTRIEVSGGGVVEVLQRMLPGTWQSAEEDVLRERCAYAPLDLRLNGRPLSRTVSTGAFASRVLRDRAGEARLPLFLGDETRTVEGFSALLTLRLPAEGQPPGWSGWSALVNGVLFPLEEPPWRHVHCLVADPRLALDLSHRALVCDARLGARLEALRREALEMIVEAAGDLDAMRRLGKDGLLRLLETFLDVEKHYGDQRDHPNLRPLVRARAVICALHGAPLVGAGVDTVRVLSKLPGFGDAGDLEMVDAACRALGRLYLAATYGDGDGYPLSEVGDDEGQRDELFELWRRLTPSHACRRAHLRLALDAVVRGCLDEAAVRVEQARAVPAGRDHWTDIVTELVKRARGSVPAPLLDCPNDDFVAALKVLLDADAAGARGDETAAGLYDEAVDRFAQFRTWAGRVWGEAARVGPPHDSAVGAITHLRRLALEGPPLTVDDG